MPGLLSDYFGFVCQPSVLILMFHISGEIFFKTLFSLRILYSCSKLVFFCWIMGMNVNLYVIMLDDSRITGYENLFKYIASVCA